MATFKGVLAEHQCLTAPCRVSCQSESCRSLGRNRWGGRSLAPLLPIGIGIDAVAFPAPSKRTLLGPDATLLCLDAKQRDAWASECAHSLASGSEADWPPQPHMARCQLRRNLPKWLKPAKPLG